MPPCHYCANLSIPRLVDLALQKFDAAAVPKAACYRHQPTFGDLEQSALGGCDLCRLILEVFKGTPEHDENEATDWAQWPVQWQSGGWGNGTKSMYTIAKDLKVSKVRIALSSYYAYWGMDHPLDEIRILDGLRVQVGPAYSLGFDDSDGSDGEDEVPEEDKVPGLVLAFSVPRSTPLYIRGFQIGRFQADPNLGSSIHFNLGNRWLQTCRENHPGCHFGNTAPLPTRVIDVGRTDGSEMPRVIHSLGGKAEYTALSHCWGGKVAPLLTTLTLTTFGLSLPYDALPANFRDAITITRRLGFRYLWIDSLCIVQDSEQDWANESRKMGDIYANSTLTISAMAASASTVGILHPDTTSPAAATPQAATLDVSSENSSPLAIGIERSQRDEESLDTLDSNSPLTARGWTLQEYVLSPRHLFYGKCRIYWKCPSAVYSDEAAEPLLPGPRIPDVTFDVLSSLLHPEALHSQRRATAHRSVVLQHYYRLVCAFSRRKLTFASDKLPAFSGLAQRLHAVIGGDYLAGLWSSDIKNGLLWTPEAGYCRHVTEPYRAPSWSWAVADGPVITDFAGETVAYPTRFDMQLLEYSVTPRDANNPFGHLKDGYLVLTGLTYRLVRTKQILWHRPSKDLSVGHALFDDPLPDGTGLGATEMIHFSFTRLYRVKTAAGADAILSIPIAKKRFSEERDTFEVDRDAFVDGEHLAFLVTRYRKLVGTASELSRHCLSSDSGLEERISTMKAVQ
ncbi:heterokaryon incompatibility protein-domain-containing protein [Staphylotrichum tortipilum]|uniref:Heterokaryon incompatibility protein-domain-containing protein n=1 Tax=Staphylotrichum tortipilum TaxID=2831512 RepID=A0AAN6RPC2_9PEZI|nr:heterokaryon incompatibility protein-domain-containing protein [Staphylotrichum longicolle]